MEDRCVSCGAIIPEGRRVCEDCERGVFSDEEVMKVLDICDKLDFFYGQRSGRERWFRKPVEVQNEDIRNFADDIQKIKSFINRQDAELDKRTIDMNAARLGMIAEHERLLTAKAEAIKEFAERLKENYEIWDDDEYHFFYVTTNEIDTLVKEMTEGGEQE